MPRPWHRALLFGLSLLLTILPSPVRAHNLNQSINYLAFDQPTLSLIQARSVAGQPLIQAGDVIGLLIKATPTDGTATGAGGYSTFFLPVGTQVVGAEYGRLDQSGSFVTMPMKGQSILSIGDGSVGAKATPGLVGLELGPNITGLTSLAVNADGSARGTLAGVYSDTGIFYSTDPKTAWQSWVSTGGMDGSTLTTGDNSMTNNSGDVVIPTTRWDAEQLIAFGMKNPGNAILDPVDQRGNTPWGMGSGAAGPESGYAWSFDKTYWDTHEGDSNRMKDSIAVGPWQRIKYPGSLASKDTPGLNSNALGYVGVDASEIGANLSPANPLPVTTSWTDDTSPKAVRFAWGFLELYRPEYARLQLKVVNGPGQANSPFSADGTLQAMADTFGGDAGGEFGNKDHLWRYYKPSVAQLPIGPYIFKQASKSLVLRNDVFSYKVWLVNFSNTTLTNVVVEDTLPSGTSFVSASPAASSGPSPLRWTIPAMPAQSVTSFVVNVRATGTGVVSNSATTYDDHHIPTSASDTIVIGSHAILYPDKTVTPSTAMPGDIVSYTITMLNEGTVSSSNPLVITERLPEGFIYTNFVAADINGAPAGVGNVAVNVSNPKSPVFTVNRGINAGQALHITFRAQISLNQPPGNYCNQLTYGYDGKVLSTGGLACVTVGQQDFGLGIGNLVFFDANSDGHADADEGIANVTVQLYAHGSIAEIDQPVATTTTDAGGMYLFQNMESGFYFVHIPSAMFQSGAPLHSYVSIAEGQYGDDDVGEDGLNDTSPATGGVSSGSVFVGLGFAPTDQDGETGINHTVDNGIDAAVNLTVDLGFQGPVGIGNLVFIDANNNGHADLGEGVGGVRVELYYASDPVGSSSYLYATTTTANGHYLFDDIGLGDYVVHIPAINFENGQPLHGLLSVTDVGGSPTGDDDRGENGLDSLAPVYSGISSDVIHVGIGTSPVDASPGSSTGETGFLASEDNVRDPDVNLTADFGFTSTVPPFTGVGNLVFEDSNGNRHFDPGEGVDGVTVQLFDASVTDPLLTAPLSTVVTSDGGSYFFGNLPPGNYFVFVPPSDFGPSGVLHNRLSVPGSSNTSNDENVDENGVDAPTPSATGVRSITFTLALGTEPVGTAAEDGFESFIDDGVDSNYDLTVDLGFYQFVGVGNLVFKDANANGHFDPGEGLANVPLQLFAFGSDPAFDSPVSSTVTASDGRFSFIDLAAGTYFIHVPASAFASGGPLHQCLSVPDTELLPGGDDNLDEDGLDTPLPASTGVSSRFFTLTPGLAPIDATHETGFAAEDDNAFDPNFDATIDLGFYQAGAPILGVGNVVFYDANHNSLHDVGEGVEGVTVKLFAAGADPLSAEAIDSALTDSRGAYLLTTNQPGDYVVFIPPSEFQLGKPLYGFTSLPGNGGDTGVDDDADENGIDAAPPSNTGIRSGSIHLEAGTEPAEAGYLADMDVVNEANSDLTVDFGFELICQTLTITPATLPDGVATISYSQTLSATGGYPPYTWDVANGALPPGLTLSSAGVLSGIAPDADTYSFTLRVTDAVGCPATRPYLFATVAVPTVGLGNAIYIDANHNGLRDSNEGVENVEVELFHAGDDPLVAVPVQEVGTDAAGTYWFHELPEGDYFVFVPANEFTPGKPLHGLVSIPGVSGDNGVDDHVTGNDNGIDSAQPEVTGISSVVVQLRFDQEPVDATSEGGIDSELDNTEDWNTDATLDLGFREPCPPINLTPASLPAATEGTAYSHQFSATGGTGAITFSVNTGSLPSGITLSSAGLLSGTTTSKGSFSFTLRAADEDGCLVDLATTLQVNGKLAVGNLIFFDRNGNGHADTGEGVDAVTVELYSSTQTPGVDTALAQTSTSGGGFWLIDNLDPGPYVVHVPKAMFASGAPLWKMKSVPGVLNTADDDAGEVGNDPLAPDISGVSSDIFSLASGLSPVGTAESGLAGASDDARDADIDLTCDLGFIDATDLPATFAAWQTLHGITGSPSGNHDQDAASDLLEYAFGDDPASGAASETGTAFSISEDQATGQMNVQLRRRHGGQGDLTCTLKVLANLGQSPASWVTTTIVPTVTNNGDGTETLTFPHIDSDPAVAASSFGFARVFLSLDADHNGTPEATESSFVLGWQHRALAVRHQSYSAAFVLPAVFTGKVDSLTGDTLDVATAAGARSLTTLLTAGREYYLEVLSGDHEGHRFEVNEASLTATTIPVLPAEARSTQTSTPASLASDLIALRPHLRVIDLFPTGDFHATGSSNTADQLQLWNTTTSTYITLWLAAAPTGQQWTRTTDATVASQNNTVIGPADGLFARPRTLSNAAASGQVRSWKFACPLKLGLNFISNPFPVDASPTDRGMTVANGFTGNVSVSFADKFNFWNGDTSTDATYNVYYKVKSGPIERWVKSSDVTGTDRSNDKLFPAGTAVFINSKAGHSTWLLPVPWTP